jgi:hypothetical protein
MMACGRAVTLSCAAHLADDRAPAEAIQTALAFPIFWCSLITIMLDRLKTGRLSSIHVGPAFLSPLV